MTEESMTCWIGDDLAVDVLFEYTPSEIIINAVLVNQADILAALNQKAIKKIENNIENYMMKGE